MSFNNSLRSCLLAALIALGSTVSGEAASNATGLLGMVQVMVLHTAETMGAVAHRGIEAIVYVFGGLRL